MFHRLTEKLSERNKSAGRANTIAITDFGGHPSYSQVDDNSSVQDSLDGKHARFSSHPNKEHHYDHDDSDDADEQSDKGHQIEELEAILLAINQLEVVKKSQTLEIQTLDRARIGDIKKWRDGPAPIDDDAHYEAIKMASLEGNMSDQGAVKLINLSTGILSETEQNQEATNALINYFSEISRKRNVQIDYQFLEQILKSSDINARDKHGQTIMHEVAREWNLDLALYLKTRGMDVDLEDNWGRTPLFVAVAANYTEMVQWLLDNGANINHQTMKSESRKPIHFAAQHDAVEAFDMLVSYGADPTCNDGFGQTPLFIAAQYAQVRVVHHLLDLGLPIATANNDAVMCLELIISNLPTETAWRALEQHMKVDNVNRKKKFFINWLGKKGAVNKANNTARQYTPPDVLEILVERHDLTLITHPVIQQLVRLKSKHFGQKYRIMNIGLFLLFTVMWTASISIHEDNNRGWTYNASLIVVLALLGQLLTFHFIYKLYSEYQSSLKQVDNEKKRCSRNMKFKQQYLHPRWMSEKVLFDKEIETIERKSTQYWSSGWNVLEAICLCMATVQFLLTVVWVARPSTSHIGPIRIFFSAVFIVVVWIRLNNCFHSSQMVGGFVAMLGECVIAVARFGFLFCEFFIPFTCAFWVLFGGQRKILSEIETDREYITFNNMVYQMYLLTIVGDYDWTDLQVIDKPFAQILVGLYFILVSVITLNLFIALMSEAIARINQIASATAYLKEAREIVLLERYFPYYISSFEKYVANECSPMVIKYERLVNEMNESDHLDKVLMQSKKMVDDMQHAVKGFREIIKSMDVFMESANSFMINHPAQNQGEFLAALTKTASFYSTYFNRLQRKTMSKVSSLIDQDDMEKFLDNR